MSTTSASTPSKQAVARPVTKETYAPAALARRDRLIVAGLLALVAILAWAFTIDLANQTAELEADMWRDMNMSLDGVQPSWSIIDALMAFVMWCGMVAAMMVPAASSMFADFATINNRRRERGETYAPAAIILVGYLAACAGFSLIATVVQWLLQTTEVIAAAMQSASGYLSAALFLAAGAYQFSPLKEKCLANSRSTDSFILSEWRDGKLGAVIMGLRHGLSCIACCAAPLALLFLVGVMDLRWAAGLAVLMSAEMLLPEIKYWRLGVGGVLIAVGLGFVLYALNVI